MRPDEADDLLRRAAVTGQPRAMGAYGAAVLEGVVSGVPEAEGLAWLMLAADRGDAAAAENLDRANASASPQDVAAAERLAGALLDADAAAEPVDLLLGFHAYLIEE